MYDDHTAMGRRSRLRRIILEDTLKGGIGLWNLVK